MLLLGAAQRHVEAQHVRLQRWTMVGVGCMAAPVLVHVLPRGWPDPDARAGSTGFIPRKRGRGGNAHEHSSGRVGSLDQF
jgi:hypothetical protein